VTSSDGAQTNEELRRDIELEDYKSWLRELEKQDRWYAETVWAVVAALGAALLPLGRLADSSERIFAAWSIWAIGAAFVHMSATFLMFRIPSHRSVSRAVATMRSALGARQFLSRDEIAGAPLLSSNPTLFRRSTRGGGAFRFLFVAHQLALGSVAAGACWVVHQPPSLHRPNAATWLLLAAAMHFTWLSWRFHWRVSEARNLGEFIITRARDSGVPVLDDAEVRLKQWFSHGTRNLREQCKAAVDAMLSYEDRRYFRWFHFGVDLRSIVAVGFRARRGGASTIPMQLARQLLCGVPRTLRRKLFEAALGMWMTRKYGKDQVLDLWLSNVPFGTPRIIGLERAAMSYFHKTLADLDELDGLLLGERVTVHTGRYYTRRVQRLIEWAVGRGVISEAQRAQADSRLAEMIARRPGEILPDLPSRGSPTAPR
jgi:hypothetical protein